MQHIDITGVRREWICTICYEVLYQVDVSKEGRVMKRGKAIFTSGLCIDPRFQINFSLTLILIILAISMLQNVFTKDFGTHERLLVDRKVQGSVSFPIEHFSDVKISSRACLPCTPLKIISSL